MNNFFGNQGQPMAPIHPAIFIGHIKQDSKEVGNIAHEILLGFNTYVEGIHVVPNQVVPPGFNFHGRTTPDLRSQRSFTLELHGRACGSLELKTLLSVTITGGVQFMEVDPAVSGLEFDYLAIVGTFENLSIIIHGAATKKDITNFAPPFPHYYDSLIYPVNYQNSSKRKTDHISRNRVILDHITGRKSLIFKYEDIVKTIVADEAKLAESVLTSVSMAHSSSRISIDMAVILVEKAFSLDLEHLQIDFDASQRALLEVSTALENCWKVSNISCGN